MSKSSMTFLSLDLETECARSCIKKCKCALIPHHSRITVIGVYGDKIAETFRSIEDLRTYLDSFPDYSLVGHNMKWDLKQLKFHGLDLSPHWSHDTMIMASCLLEKIPESYLLQYARIRKVKNKELTKGFSHREAGALSLKTLAPYFLGVEAFWENPENHDSDEYVLKDCQYTYELFHLFRKKMEEEETYLFYLNKMIPAAHMLFHAETRGIKLDLPLMEKLAQESRLKATDLKMKLDIEWNEAYQKYFELKETELRTRYTEMTTKALLKAKEENKDKVGVRYTKLFEEAKTKLEFGINLSSPTQMLWLLKEYFHFDTKVEVRDKKTNIKTLEDSTGVEVLQRIYNSTQRPDIKLFLDYREQIKLIEFFETYKDLQHNGVIHCNINPAGTRTGRLSSDLPNLQQVPSNLHCIFIAREGYELASFDEAAIEARILAYYSDDPVLYDLVINDKDIHGFHTKMFFDLDCEIEDVKPKFKPLRNVTKNIGFGLYYGAGANRIKQEAMSSGHNWSNMDCQRKVEKFRETYQTCFAFKKELDKAAEKGYLSNLFGRKFYFSDPEDIYMLNLNTLIQSSASDLVYFSALKIQNEFNKLGIDAHVLLLVHDELLVEVPKDQKELCTEIIKRGLTNYQLDTAYGNLPLAVEGQVAACWAK